MGKKSRQKWIDREQAAHQHKVRSYRNRKIWKFLLGALILMGLIGVGSWQGWQYYQSKKIAMENKDKQIAVIETDKGTIRFRLYDSAAPKTVANFVKLTESGFYDGVKFHRVIEDFMIQTGDPLSRDESKKDQWGTGGSGNKFDDEINPWSLELDAGTIRSLQEQGYVYNRNLSSRKNTVGAVSMANSGPNTNDSQFFIITQKDQPHLNGKHTVFGEVIEGMETVLAIRQDDIIKKITIEKEGEKTDTKTITEDVSSDANNIISNPTIEATTTSGQPIKIELAE